MTKAQDDQETIPNPHRKEPAMNNTAITDIITPALGEYATDFDVEGIFRALRDYDMIEWDGENFVQTCTADEFWAIAPDFAWKA